MEAAVNPGGLDSPSLEYYAAGCAAVPGVHGVPLLGVIHAVGLLHGFVFYEP